jgi:hypothetical protein
MNQCQFDEALAQAVIACGLNSTALPSSNGHSIAVAVLYDLNEADFARFKPGSPHAGKVKLVCSDCAPVFFDTLTKNFRQVVIFHLDGLAPGDFTVYEVMSR